MIFRYEQNSYRCIQKANLILTDNIFQRIIFVYGNFKSLDWCLKFVLAHIYVLLLLCWNIKGWVLVVLSKAVYIYVFKMHKYYIFALFERKIFFWLSCQRGLKNNFPIISFYSIVVVFEIYLSLTLHALKHIFSLRAKA